MTNFILATVLAVSLPGVAGSATIEVPLTGAPVTAVALDELRRLPGVTSIVTDGRSLTVEVAEDAEVRIRDIADVLADHAPQTEVDLDRLGISRHTIFELNAGVCFFCAEQPLGQTLARRAFVEDWSVVDYQARIEPNEDVRVEALGGTETFEDIVLTARYDGAGAPDLYWPTGSVEWRLDEATARQEATASKKPLMIFPTAGT